MISADGWFDWAIKAPPRVAGGTNGGRNGGKGIIPHSAVGNWATLPELMQFLEGRITAPPGKKASWAATNMKKGIFYQHFSVWEQTWTSGVDYANNNFFAFENEGGGYIGQTPNFSEPLTPQQTANIIRAGKDLMDAQKWVPRRPVSSSDKTASLYEHCEMVRFGAAATACPSGRIPWNIIVPALQTPEEDDVKPYLAWDIGRKRWYFVGVGGACWVTENATIIELEKQFGPLERKAYSTGVIGALGG